MEDDAPIGKDVFAPTGRTTPALVCGSRRVVDELPSRLPLLPGEVDLIVNLLGSIFTDSGAAASDLTRNGAHFLMD